MAWFLVGRHGALCMAGDPRAPRLPIAIGPGGEPLVEVPLLEEDPDANTADEKPADEPTKPRADE